MSGLFKEFLSKNLRKPQKGLGSLFVKKFFEKKTTYLEVSAVKACNIQPDDVVLEVGFGSGIGLEAAYQYVKDGKGQIYGLDFSESMVNLATKRMQSAIQKGKVHIQMCDINELPYKPQTFDHVFHCNCYYFWDDQVHCGKQLYNVMKPGSKMITALNKKALGVLNSKGYMKYGNTNPDNYMKSLEKAGFTDVKMEHFRDTSGTGWSYQIIFASVLDKDGT